MRMSFLPPPSDNPMAIVYLLTIAWIVDVNIAIFPYSCLDENLSRLYNSMELGLEQKMICSM